MGRGVVIISLSLISMMGCKSTRSIAGGLSTSIIEDARSYIGTPYRYAGTSAKGMDCSGLTSVVFDQSNIALSRTAAAQSKQGRTIKLDEARSGDLVFYKKGGKVFHVGIVSKINKGQLWMIHSSSSKGVVEQEVLSNSYWRPKLHIIKRID